MPKDDWAKARRNDIARRATAEKVANANKRRHNRNKPRESTPYLIPAGMTVSICKANDENRAWTAHSMRKTLRFYKQFKSPECQGKNGAAIFKFKDYLILAKKKNVKR